MNYKRFLGAALAALMIVIIVTLGFAPDASAAPKYQTLYRFTGGTDGEYPGGMIFDAAGNLYGTTEGSQGGIWGGVFKLTPNPGGSWTETTLYSFTTWGEVPVGGLIFDPAGNLYGATYPSGGTQGGSVFKLTPNQDGSWTKSTLYSFCSLANCSDGNAPETGLIFDDAGNLYGATMAGGNLNAVCGDPGGFLGCGVVFELTPSSGGSWTESVLYSFCSLKNCVDGIAPEAGLIFDPAGNLYGTTFEGGPPQFCVGQFGCGTVFKLTPDHHGSWTESVLHRFIGGKGGYGPSGVTFDKAGNLYGATIYDGLYGNGVVFMLTPTPGGSWRYKVLHQEIGTWDGYGDGLIFDHAENLYGAASFGGDLNYCEGFGCGTVFKLAPNAKGVWHETVLHTFRGKPGAGPGSLIFDAAGNLYGATSGHYAGNNGSLFEITP